MSSRIEEMMDVIDQELEPTLQEVALADAIAWQIAKDEGEDEVTVEIWERAVSIAVMQLGSV